MKITSSKPAPAPKAAESPQPSTTKSGNTGIVPPTQSKPEDSFQSAKPTGTGSASGSSGITLNKPTSTSTYTLSPALEPFRAEFDKVGKKIAKLPSHVQEDAILRESARLSKRLAEVASPAEVESGVRTSALYWGRSTTTDDPQVYAARVVDTAVDTAKDVGSLKDRLQDYGSSITQDPSLRNPRNILRSARQPRPEQQPDETRQLFRRMPRWF